MKVFNSDYLSKLIAQAQCSRRKRQHSNIHESYADPCQRLFNAIEPGSYIRPHRHASDPKNELLIAVRGLMALVTFDEQGNVVEVIHFGADRHGKKMTIGAELPANKWHTVIALESGCILLEVKEGPFDPSQPKDFAPWAPQEDEPFSQEYLKMLTSKII